MKHPLEKLGRTPIETVSGVKYIEDTRPEPVTACGSCDCAKSVCVETATGKKYVSQEEAEKTVQRPPELTYKDRFVDEYDELLHRYDKLDRMTVKYEAGTLNFKPDCSLELLLEQKKYMGQYLRVLKIRAEIEGIDL